VIAWAAGPREATLAETVVQQTRQRTAVQAGVGWISDGWEPYADAVDLVYRDPQPTDHPRLERLVRTPGTALTQAIKHRQGRRLTRVEVRAAIGDLATLPYAVHLERLNGTLRDRLACLTRKTHAFAKSIATWDALLSLALFTHNWCLPHVALRHALSAPEPGTQRRYHRRTPAMALGLTDHLWSLTAFLAYPLPHRT
jgi:hypothetical protein